MASLIRPEVTPFHILLILSRSKPTQWRSHQLSTLQYTLEGLYNFGRARMPLQLMSSALNLHDDILPVAYGLASHRRTPGTEWLKLLRQQRSAATRKRFFNSARKRGENTMHVWRHLASHLNSDEQRVVYRQNPFHESIDYRLRPQELILLEDRIRRMLPGFEDRSSQYVYLLRKDQLAVHRQQLSDSSFIVLSHIPPRRAGLDARINAYARYIASHVNTHMQAPNAPTLF